MSRSAQRVRLAHSYPGKQAGRIVYRVVKEDYRGRHWVTYRGEDLAVQGIDVNSYMAWAYYRGPFKRPVAFGEAHK